MITIKVDNSYSQILGLNPKDFNKLRLLLSYRMEARAASYAGGFNPPRHLCDIRGNFPSGLLPKVKEFVLSLKAPSRLIDVRKTSSLTQVPIAIQKPITPYPWQLKAVEVMAKHLRGGVVASTGSGKSMAIAMIIDKLKLKTLIVVPTLEIKNQLKADLLELFGSLAYVTVENIDSSVLRTPAHYDMLIIDECHRSAAKSYRTLNKKLWNNIVRRYFFSATFFRNQDNEHLLFEGVAGQVIYELTYQEAVKAGYIVPVEAFYYDLELQPVQGHTWAQVYNELVINNEHRNALIAKFLMQLEAQGLSALCLVREVAHGKTIAALTGLPFAHGQDGPSRTFIQDFNKGGMCLIGTTGILSEGVNTKPCEFVVIAGLGKAKSAFLQQIGRAVRTYPGKESAKVLIFRDKSHKWSLAHFNAQKKILLDCLGVKVIKLD